MLIKPHIHRAEFEQNGESIGFYWSCNGAIGETAAEAYASLREQRRTPFAAFGNPRVKGCDYHQPWPSRFVKENADEPIVACVAQALPPPRKETLTRLALRRMREALAKC